MKPAIAFRRKQAKILACFNFKRRSAAFEPTLVCTQQHGGGQSGAFAAVNVFSFDRRETFISFRLI